MSTYSCQLSKNKGLMLNRFTARPNLTQYIESCAITEEVEASHSFHKIMVDKWSDDNEVLFHTLSNYFESSLIPINTLNVGNMTSFYTSNLNLILKIINLDFKFPYARSTYHLSIIFNEKTSVELFGSRKTLEDIVCDVINRRFNKNQELDLSKMSKDQEFLEYKINFYHLSLLSHFKTLMLRVGKETKSLNLSKNNLKKIPLEILNFFIKGDLTSIDLSYNKIQSLSDLSRVSSKIEKLWIEGNPLCDDIEPNVYVRNVISKFPRLIELDGIKLNDYGTVPIRRNYLATPDNVTKLVVERFLITFFSLYDDKKLYKSNSSLYDDNATFTLTTDFSEVEQARYGLLHYLKYSRNFLNSHNDTVKNLNKKIYDKKSFTSILQSQPATLHDPYTFTVDVLKHDVESLILVVGGVFKEVKTNKRPEIVFKFRRTFVLAIHPEGNSRAYCIKNDMLYIALASPDEINNSFKYPIINFNTLALINPNHEEIEALVKAFMKITNLKRTQAEIYLKLFGWDIYAALNRLRIQVKSGELPRNNFVDEEDDFSDASSTLDID